MSDCIINAQNLTKEFWLPHENRDTVRERLFKIFRPTTYEVLKAVDNVSFEVKRGEFVGIIGRNGSGKSTLLKLAAGVLVPTSGYISIEGKVAPFLELGVGFQPELSGKDNVFLYGAMLGLGRKYIQARFGSIVEFSGLERFIDQKFKNYSTGMQARLGFSISAHVDADLIFVDEVLSVGDLSFQKKCIQKIGELHRMGRTVLFVSHDLGLVQRECDTILWLDSGKLRGNGQKQDLVGGYLESMTSANKGEDAEMILVREWGDGAMSPQNKSILLKRICVSGSMGETTGRIYTDTGFSVELEFEGKIDGGYAGTTIIFRDLQGNIVLSSISNHEPHWYGRPLAKGRYKSVCRIPANFFNDGRYSISLNIFGENFSDEIYLENLLVVRIFDGSGVRGDYTGEYKGVVRPLFSWETRKL